MRRPTKGIALSRAEAVRWAKDGRLREATERGMVLVQSPNDPEGGYELLPWTATSTRDSGGQAGRVFAIQNGIDKLKADLPPLLKRTPQQRVESLVLRILEQTLKSGTVPGLNDEAIRGIVGEAWKAGETQVTGEMVRRVVQHYLEMAEKKQDEVDSKFITRPR